MNNTKEKNVKGILLLLVIAVLIMSVGFAVYSQSLNINGTVTVKASKWDIRYNSTYTETTNSEVASAKSYSGDTTFSFTVTLNEPGDFYEATVEAENFGTFDAKMKKITMSSLTTDQAKYLSYTVTYGGTAYTATTDDLNVALAAGAKAPVKVRVEYLQPANSDDLPENDVVVTVTGSLDYEQVQ